MSTKKRFFSIIIIFVFIFILNFNSTKAYLTVINVTYTNVKIDISRGAFHDEFYSFEGNMTLYQNTVDINSDIIIDLNSTSGFFISQPDSGYSPAEKEVILNFLKLGNRTLFVTGDNDYGGYFSTIGANDLLFYLNSSLRLGSDSIEDSVSNAGAVYRVLANEYGTGELANITKEGCLGGCLMHGPSSVLGYNGTNVIDLRNEAISNVEILLQYSENSFSYDADVSDDIYDYYANHPVQGNHPAVVCERKIYGSNVSYIIVAGEVNFADYQRMYDQYTEQDYVHYGQMFVNNIVSFFLENATFPPIINEFQNTLTLSITSSILLVCIIIFNRKKK